MTRAPTNRSTPADTVNLRPDVVVHTHGDRVPARRSEEQPVRSAKRGGGERATSEILASGLGGVPDVDGLQELLSTLSEGDYVAIQAYVDPTPATEELLRRLRMTIRDRYGVATTVGDRPALPPLDGTTPQGRT